jgi:hypothetical protein
LPPAIGAIELPAFILLFRCPSHPPAEFEIGFLCLPEFWCRAIKAFAFCEHQPPPDYLKRFWRHDFYALAAGLKRENMWLLLNFCNI